MLTLFGEENKKLVNKKVVIKQLPELKKNEAEETRLVQITANPLEK